MAAQWADACGLVDEAATEAPTPTAEAWHLIEIRVVPGDPLYEVYIDGALLLSVDETRDPSDANSIAVGLFNDFVLPTSFAYIADVKVGTTRGDDDLFSEDFSGGTLANFDGTLGTVSVVPAPAYSGSGAHTNAMLADSTVDSISVAYKNLASEPIVWLSVVVGFDTAALDGWAAGGTNDFSSGFFGSVLTDANPSSAIGLNGAVYITALADSGPPAVYEEPLWRFVVTNLDLEIVTILTPLAHQRRVVFTLDAPAQASGVVPSDNPEINILQAGHPFLDEGRRCLLGFRREGGSPPWVIRFAGIIEQLEDAVDESGEPTGRSTYTAWDPWKLLYSRPVLKNDGTLPAQAGLVFRNTPANEIATVLLDRVLTYTGEHHIMTGVVQTCPEMDIAFQQGSSVGEAWDQLCQSGFIDITLTPVYDPVGHPSKLVALNIQHLVGRTRHKAIFSWDMPMRSLHGISRLTDGTQRANRVRMYAAQGGPTVGTVSDFTSVATYGDYWLQQFLSGQIGEAVQAVADTKLLLLKDGLRTYTVKPTAEVSPRPFLDYGLGDSAPLLASANLREKITATQRIYEIPIDIDDEGIETVSELTFSQDNLTT